MAYRVAKKTTKSTEYHCLKCKHLKAGTYEIHRYNGCMVECNAPNRCLREPFNARDFYCVEYPSIGNIKF